MNLLFQTWLDAFASSLRFEKQKSIHTVDGYLNDCTEFLSFCEKESLTHLNQMNDSLIRRYLKVLENKNRQRTTLARKLSALKHFFDFLLREEVIETNPAKDIEFSVPKPKLPKSLSKKEVSLLIQWLGDQKNPKDAKKQALIERDQLVFLLLYATGMRVSELSDLCINQLDLENSYIRVSGKGKKERLVPIPPELSKKMAQYITDTRPVLLMDETTNEVFLNAKGSGLSRQGVWKRIQSWCLSAGIEKSVSPHTLRHTFATHLLESGMNLRSLQILLGHSSINSTEIYTALTPSHLKTLHKKFHPRGD